MFISNETASFLNTLTSINPNRKIIGKCPICGKDVVETSKYFMCSQYKKDSEPCDFIFSKTVSGQTIKTEEFQDILNGKKTKQKKFKSQTGNTFFASIGLIEEEDSDGINKKKVAFIFSSGEVIGTCPKCGNNIIDKSGSFACESEDCNFFIAKTLKGTTITATDVKNLISGKSTATKKFFSGKKPWYAKLKYSNDFTKLNFEFQDKN